MNRGHRSRVLSLACAAFAGTGLIFSGCHKAHMAVSPDLRIKAEAMPVKGRQGLVFRESFRFGPYHVTEVKRGWTTTLSWWTVTQAKQSYHFTLIDSGGTLWRAQCAVQARMAEPLAASAALLGSFQPKAGGQEWRLTLSDAKIELIPQGVLEGVLTDGTTTIHVKGTRKLAGSPLPLSEATGYHFSLEGRPIGAVEVINDGMVWLHPAIEWPLRPVLAVTAAALLLYRDLRETVEE